MAAAPSDRAGYGELPVESRLLGPDEAPAEAEEERVEVRDFDKDAYGLFVLRLTEWWDPRDITAMPKMAVLAATILWVLNVCFQGGITFALLQACEALERPFEVHRLEEDLNMSVADATSLLRQGAHEPDEEKAESTIPETVFDKCVDAVGVRTEFYAMLIFLWFVKNWSEMEKSVVQLTMFLRVRTRVDPTHEILSGDGSTIVRLDVWQKYALCVLITAVKLCVVVPVTYAGSKFLILQRSETTVLLKALCMQFVVTIDELLLVLATTRTKQSLSKFKLQSVPAPLPPALRHRKSAVWDTSLGLAFSLLVTTIYVIGIMWVLFPTLTNFRIACNEYASTHGLPNGAQTPAGIADLF